MLYVGSLPPTFLGPGCPGMAVVGGSDEQIAHKGVRKKRRGERERGRGLYAVLPR